MTRANEDPLSDLFLGQQQVLQEVHGILEEEQKKDDLTSAIVLGSKGSRINRIERLDPDRIWSQRAIALFCATFRYRFLDAGLFKGSLPPRAHYELRRLEMRAQAPLRGFKVMAPAARFITPGRSKDAILFVQVGERQYYLVHQWGEAPGLFRALVMWPLRGPRQLFLTALFLAVQGALLLPDRFIVDEPQMWWGWHRLVAFWWSMMAFGSLAGVCWAYLFDRFSQEAWNKVPRNG